MLVTWATVKILPAQFVVEESLPPQPPTEEHSRKSATIKPVQLVYDGEPIVVPLDCAYTYFEQAGIVCSNNTPCELFLELAAVETAGEHIFVAGNIHTISATIASIMLRSEDAGKTWHEPVNRYAGGVLEYIQFVDKNHGWAAGQQRELDSSAKPLLLSTYNAGKRWQRYPVSQNDDHTGTILDFYFDTEEHGLMIVDRGISAIDPFELYESMNGGRSWLIRQITNHKPRLRNRPAALPDSNWRILADLDTANYRIEQHRENGWSTRSRFTTNLGTCNTMEQTPSHK